MFNLTEELNKLPKLPGVYIMRDEQDGVIYVGKAKNLRSRIRSYFHASGAVDGRGPQIARMLSVCARFEYIVTDSELEALVLENNLIKEHAPRYNTLLKDGKTYPYIKVTVKEKYPRLLFSREIKKDGSRYYGPYVSAAAVKEVLELAAKIFQLRRCKRFPSDARACLNYHIGMCMAPCQGHVHKADYDERVRALLDFLGGNMQAVLKELKEKMTTAAQDLDFEAAAQLRDLMGSVKSIGERQKASDTSAEDKDVIAVATDADSAVVQVFFIREGKLIGREHFYMTQVTGSTTAQILGDFIKQFYAGTPFIPREMLISEEIPEIDILEEWLSGRRQGRVHITVPKIGDKEKLAALAAKNAAMTLEKDKERLTREARRTSLAADELASCLGLSNLSRIEAYDISNISGFLNVGSMVVFESGKPKRSDYRKFKIKSVDGPDDYACMKELLTRRLKHGLSAGADAHIRPQYNEHTDSFSVWPDLILVDGGRGQTGVVLRVLSELGFSIPVCGMVKDDKHKTRGLFYAGQELKINKNSEGFRLLTRIQDEAHRFAVEYHRTLRQKGQVRSVLDDIPGVGPARRRALMRRFGSLDDIKAATVEELSAIPEIPWRVAEEIYGFFGSGQ